MTDKDRVTAAFKNLRRQGYTARQNFLCCGGCAMSQLATEVEKGKNHDKFVTYNRQGGEAFGEWGQLKDSLYLNWAGSAEEIVLALNAEGLVVAAHDGGKELSIEIFPFRPGHEKLANKVIRFMSGEMPKFGAFDGEDFDTFPQILALALRRAGVKEDWKA